MLNFQPIKDTFYLTLRDRIALGNPARTLVVRGTIRPAVLVVENEFPASGLDDVGFAETFLLHWLELAVDHAQPGPLATLKCQVRYASEGSVAAFGLDRGRALAAMDAELASALSTSPLNAGVLAVTEAQGGGQSSSTLTGSNIFWGDLRFAAPVVRAGRLERTVNVEVFGYGD